MSKKANQLQNEEITQAVIFAQSFDPKFGPLNLARPKVLLPLVNRPMLEYSLEMLARSNIEEVFIFCNQNQNEIQSAIKEFRTKNCNKEMTIQLFVREAYDTLGSSIRELDAKALIKGHFVLLFGDCVGNLKLRDLIEVHKENVKKDPGCVMTNIYRRVHPNHRIRHNNQETVLLLDPGSKIIFYDNSKSDLIELPKDLLEGNTSSLHYDLLDTFVSICSNKVPPDFSDNFDYESRDDFLHGLLASVELLQHFVYAHILEDQYASRVVNVSTYDSVSRDIIQRYSYPIAPDSDTDYSYRSFHNIYLHNEIVVVDKSGIKQNVIVGSKTSIGDNRNISESVIGDNCQIGQHVTIEGSYIWNDVVIGDGCIIRQSIICSGVKINAGCNVEAGSLIAENVILDKSLPENSYVINDRENDSEKGIVGEGGAGQLFRDGHDSDDEEAIDYWGNKKALQEDDNQSVSTTFSDSSDDPISDDDFLDEFRPFFDEVHESLLRGVEEKLLAENLILEINSSKHAYNVPIKEVNTLVVKAILSLSDPTQKDYFAVTIKHLKYALPIIQNYMKSSGSQIDGIHSIEEFYLENEETLSAGIFVKILQYFYRQDVFDEETILNWFNKPNILPDFDSGDQQRVRKQPELKPFITWLMEAEEESSESESD